MVPATHDSAAAVLFPCWVVRETEWSADLISIFGLQHCVERDFMRAEGDYFFCRVCLTNHGRDCRLGEM